MSDPCKFRRWVAVAVSSVVALQMLSLAAATAAEPRQADPGIERAIQVQERNSWRLMTKKGVVGCGTGLDQAGKAVIRVFAATAAVGEIPREIEGVPVEIEVTGEIFAMPKPAAKPGKPPAPDIDPTDRFLRPAPIGVSTGAEWTCDAGTIACRLRNLLGGEQYVLSNHHVYHGYLGINTIVSPGYEVPDDVFQPARLDDPNDGCFADQPTTENRIGTIVDFVPIQLDGTPNTVDAAIALLSPGTLGNGTPVNGYGVPSTTILPVDGSLVGLAVQKYGRTTALTQGAIIAIGSEVWVSYGTDQVALFVNQITVSARNSFIKPGDSGSLLVSDDDACNPVGLLFAGNRTGKIATANPIDDVLTAFDLKDANGVPTRILVVDGD